MEQAKEAVGVVSEFFAGNPFSTAVGTRIEQATEGSLASENWGLNMEICDVINSTEDGPRDAIRAIKKRLLTQIGKSNTSVMFTLTVLETAVKNGDMRFHLLVCDKEFVQELVKIIGAKYDPPTVIQEKVLGLIQAWADAFREAPGLEGVVEVYNELKCKGVEFPMTDIDAMAPIITPKPTHSPVHQPTPPNPVPIQSVVPEPQVLGSIIPTPEQLAKLRSEFDVVQGNLRVLREMLSELVPGKEAADDMQLLTQLHSTCRAMQQRCIELLQSVQHEEVTNELLLVNDDFNNVFSKYERYMKNRTGQPQENTQNDKPTPASAGDSNLIDLGEASQTPNKLAAMSLSNAQPATDVKSTTSSYADNTINLDQTSLGLAAAAQQRANMAPQPSKAELEAKEMEEWLQKQDKEKTPEGTSKDFDEFLSNRVEAAEKCEAKDDEQKVFGL